MCYTLKHKEVRIKKDRKCWACGDTTVAGRKMLYIVSKIDDHFSDSYWCEVCEAFMRCGAFDEGVTFEEFKGENEYYKFKKEYLCQPREVIIEKYDIWNKIRKEAKSLQAY